MSVWLIFLIRTINRKELNLINIRMKGLLVLLAIVAVCVADTRISFAPQGDGVDFVAFIKGFLEGINEKGDINKLLQCIKGGEEIVQKIITAINYLKNMNFENIIKGLTLLFEAIKQLLEMLKPCMEGFDQLKKLLNAIAHVDIKKIALKILTHPTEFLKDITKAIECFGKGDLFCAGKCIGDLLRMMFLSARVQAEPIADFLTGFLKGIHEVKNIDDLLKCIRSADPILEKIQKALELIKTLNVESMLEGLTMLFEAMFELEEMLRPCLEEFSQFRKLIEAIMNLNIDEVVQKIIANAFQFLADIIDCIQAFQRKNYNQAGRDLGDIMYRLFLVQLTVELDPVEFIKGLLEGLNEKGDVNNLLKCVKDLERIVSKIMQSLEYIKKGDFVNVIKGITMLLEAVTELMQSLKPCAEGFDQIKKLIDAISHVDIVKLVFKILGNPGPYIADVVNCIDCFNKNDWHGAGKNLGDLLCRLFLTSRV